MRGGDDPESYRITIGETELRWLSGLWEAQTRRPPTEDELRALVEDYVREEILFREALRLGLDRGDTIIRRRLAQKMGFLLEDNVAIDTPTPEELGRYFEDNRDRYREPLKLTFMHVYLSRDQRGESARNDAVELLAELTSSQSQAGGDDTTDDRWRRLGDPFMLRREYAERSQQEIAELFGAGFAEDLTKLDVGGWHGPIESVYGYHLAQVVARRDSTLPSLDLVRTRLIDDIRAQRRSSANDDAYRELRSRYEVVSDLETSEDS